MNDQVKPLITEQKYKSQTFIIKVLLNISISSLLVGYSNAYFSSIDYEDFTRIFGITGYKAFYQGFLIGLIPLTSSVGGFIASFMLKKLSRMQALLYLRQCFFFINVIYIVITFGLMIKNLYMLIVLRLIQGCLSGVFSSLVPLYIKEFSPLQLNSKMGTFYQMLNVFGLSIAFFVSYICSLLFTPQFYWRIVFAFPLVLIAFQSYNLVYFYHYDTPKYLLGIQKVQEARELLRVIYKEEFAEERLVQLKKIFQLSSNRIFELKTIKKNKSNEQIQENNQQRHQQVQYYNNKLAIYASIHISTLQQFSGISIVVGYGAEIVKKAFPSLAKILPIFLHFEAVIACLLTIELLKNQGRKTLIQWGAFGCGVFTLLLGYKIVQIGDGVTPIGTGIIVLVSLFAYRFIYGVTIGPVAFLYIPEIVEPNIMPIVIVIYWMSASTILMLFPILKQYVFDNNPGPLFVIFGTYTLLSLIINHFVIVETKGKRQFEVRLEYDRLLGIQHKNNPQDSFSRIKL